MLERFNNWALSISTWDRFWITFACVMFLAAMGLLEWGDRQ